MRPFILLLPVLLSISSPAQKARKYTQVTQELTNQVISTPVSVTPIRLAVVPFAATKYSTQNSTQFGGYLTESIIGSLAGHPAKIKLFERTRLDAVLKEQEFILTDLMKPAAALKIGQLVPIDALLSGTYTKLKSYIDVSARLIDVASGEILMSYNGRIKMDKNLATLFQAAEPVVIVNNNNTPANNTPVNVTVNNTINNGNNAPTKSRKEICSQQREDFLKRMSDLSSQEKIDALVRDAVKVPFEDFCGALHYDIMYSFSKFKIEHPLYKQFILATLDTIANPIADNRAYEIIRYVAADDLIDENEWRAGLQSLKRNGSYSLSTYLAYLISKPKGNDLNISKQRVDEFLELLIQNKIGLPRPISFETGFLEMMEGMRYNQTLGEYVYKNYSPRLNLDDRSKISVFHELDYIYQYETRAAHKTEIIDWLADFFNKYEYEKAYENLYEFAFHFLLTDYEDRNEKIKRDYPESDLKILIEKCRARFASYATTTLYPSQKEDRINFCVKYNIPITGVIPSLEEAAQMLRGNNLEEQLRVVKLLVQMGNRPKVIETDLIRLFDKRTLDDKEKLRNIQTLAVQILGNTATQNPRAINYMINSLTDYDNESYAAEDALVKIGKASVAPIISKLDKTTYQDGGLQYRLITILGKIGKDAAPATGSIQRILKINRNKDVVYAAEAALQAIR
jgi:TolB-like protein